MLRDIVLPSDWRERALRFPASGVNGPWIHAAQRILERGGDPALTIEEVQDLVLAATGIDADRSIRNPAWLERIPNWAVDASLAEVGNPGSLWNAFQRLRAAHDELAVLDRFLETGCRAIEGIRGSGHPDWHLVGPRGAFHVEVKSKGDREDAYDFVYSAAVSAQLLDRTGAGRSLEWRIHGDEGDPSFTSPETRIDQVARLIHDAYPVLSEWLRSKPRLWQCMAPFRSGDLEVRCTCHVPEVELEIRGESCLLTFYGSPTEPWFFHSQRSKADYAPSRLDLATRNKISDLLGRLLIGERGSQLRTAPTSTLFVVRWHAPFAWDGALSEYEDDMMSILGGLTEQASAFRAEPALGLWVEAFSNKTSRRVYLNPHAQGLLGMESVAAAP